MVERIKQLCKEKGLTINAVEMATGIGRHNIARWDENKPNVEKVKKVADYLGVTINYLMGDDSDIVNNTLQKAFDERPEMRMLFSVAENATKEDIEQAIKIIEALKK